MTAMRGHSHVPDSVLHQLPLLVGDLLCLCRDGRLAWLNEAGARLLGLPAAEALGRPFTDFLHPDHAAALAGGLTPLATAEPGGAPFMLRLPNGGSRAVIIMARATDDGALVILARECSTSQMVMDTLLRTVKRLEARARDNDLLARVVGTASEGIMVLDRSLRITTVNPAFTEITGWPAPEVIGRKPRRLLEKGADRDAALLIYEAARTSGRWQGEQWNRRKGGERYAERLGVSVLRDEAGEVLHYVVVFSDITQRKLDEERIRKQANFDTLTGLPNRALFIDRLGQAVHQAERNGQMVGLMFIDLDGFKLINDTLGHDMGDLLLRDAGERLSHCVRSGDTVARLGGDEFTVLMPHLGTYQNAPVVAQRILDALKAPFDLAGNEAFVSASIGITVFPEDAGDANAMLKNADAAMYRAKEQGKANFQFFTRDMNAAVVERLAIKTGLLKAFEREELQLHFQPKLALADRSITGVEALLRWRTAELGQVSPAKFIPVMEESGLIGEVGEWAIHAACKQHGAWARAGLAPPRIAINLSVRQLRAPGFVELVEQALAGTGTGPEALEFEITEGSVMKDAENAVAVLRRLSDMGIRLAMDDFGTGTSSLSVLKRFPVDSIKIDRSFIADLGRDDDSQEIVRAIISMGHALKRRIIAEGVESPEQVAILERLGCDEIQGFVLSQPLPPEQLPALLACKTLP